MQVLTDAQWVKFEAAIEAVKIRGARPRKEDRRTIEAIIWHFRVGEPKTWFETIEEMQRALDVNRLRSGPSSKSARIS